MIVKEFKLVAPVARKVTKFGGLGWLHTVYAWKLKINICQFYSRVCDCAAYC